MNWQPISEEKIYDLVNEAWKRMSIPQRRLWEVIQIEPRKWALHPQGDSGGGFWVVAVIGQVVVWYNDIEDGFNLSRYTSPGTIDAYWCNQDELEWMVQHILTTIADGMLSDYFTNSEGV